MAEWNIITPKEKYSIEDSITTKILKIRGIKDKETFLNPKKTNVNSPWLLSNMSEAVNKIIYAMNNNLDIGIYADTDTDGVTSATIIYKYLKKYNINPILLYHQRKDGHGVIVEKVPKDLDLLIIVDSSSNSVKECFELHNNMDVIILDHHEIENNNAYATIVNPKCNNYSNKYLSGAGVAYQTCRAIDELLNTFYADDFIDICAVGLIGDMMNVVNPETRYLIYKGLLKINNNCDKNIMAILKSLKKDYKPNATTIAYYLVPFINSIIRLGKIQDVIEILTTDNDKRLKELIKLCGIKNEDRKVLQNDIVEQIDKNIDLTHKIIIINASDLNVNKTMNGLIANNIAQKYQKPTLVVSLDTDTNMLVGSGRGYGNEFDFKELMSYTGLFENVAGHSGAFGVEFPPNNLEIIHKTIDENLELLIQDFAIEADMEIDVNDITWDFAYELQRLAFITGQGFKEPLFVIKGLVTEDPKIMKEVHLKFKTEDLECVKFNVSQEEIQAVEDSICVDILGNISVNSWYNFRTKQTIKTKQVMLKDIICY